MPKKPFNLKYFRFLTAKQDQDEPETHHPQRHRHGHRHGLSREFTKNELTLSDCREGDEMIIRRLETNGPLRRRLLEMGLNPGAAVRVIKYAPLKDPLECEIKGYHIALRVSEAGAVIVEPLAP
jgi:Fe2+ transport system protein FeoA